MALLLVLRVTVNCTIQLEKCIFLAATNRFTVIKSPICDTAIWVQTLLGRCGIPSEIIPQLRLKRNNLIYV